MPLPKYHALFNPTLEAMHTLGGSASITELVDEVIRTARISENEAAEPHNDRMTELEYRLTWARSYLKTFGLMENTSRGIWVLTPKGKDIKHVDPREVVRYVRLASAGRTKISSNQDQPSFTDPQTQTLVLDPETAITDMQPVVEITWQEQLMSILQNLSPDAFERLCQRLLRESGFVQVQVTGRSGDGGIDGVGIVRLGGLLGFPVLFQCKRYVGSVSSPTIRDFRGAMVGRADRGLVLTTGRFTIDARKEATRDGAPPIDLVDGEQLMEKLKELRLGVTVRLVEEAAIDAEWFTTI